MKYKEGAVKNDRKKQKVDIEQAYYFLKFTLHKDRFHTQTNEYIVPILRYKPYYDEKDYVSKMIDGIEEYVSVVRKERSGDYQGLQRLLGIITYIETLYGLSGISEEKKRLERLERVSDTSVAYCLQLKIQHSLIFFMS